MQVLKKFADWERRTGYFRLKKKSKNEIRLLGRCWEWKSTSLISLIFGLLINVGKKIVHLQCGFKSWCGLRDIDCGYDVILQKHLLV